MAAPQKCDRVIALWTEFNSHQAARNKRQNFASFAIQHRTFVGPNFVWNVRVCFGTRRTALAPGFIESFVNHVFEESNANSLCNAMIVHDANRRSIECFAHVHGSLLSGHYA